MTDGLGRKLLVLAKWLIMQLTFGHCFVNYLFWTGFLRGLFVVFQLQSTSNPPVQFVQFSQTLLVRLVGFCTRALLRWERGEEFLQQQPSLDVGM